MTQLSRLDAPVETAPSNTFTLCASAPAFVDSLREELQHCTTSVLVQFMTFEGDASGNQLADLLIEKAAEGLDVRLILDHYVDVIANDILPFRIGHRRELNDERASTNALLARLVAGGVELQRTAPPGPFWKYLLYRNHKKMVVLDDRIAFVGGINVSDHNYAWNDFMVKVAGPLAADIARDFRSTWDGATVAFDEPRDGDFVLNQRPGRPSISAEVNRMIDAAQQSVTIESPSLLGDSLERRLLEAGQRGVQVTAVIPARHNRTIMRVWLRATLARLRHPNITIHGYRGSDDMTHAKLLIVDDRTVTFGSFNLFELEGLTQKELNVFTRDPAIVAALSALVARDIASSSLVTVPRTTFGRFTYSLVYRLFERWTRRLLRKPGWVARYG